MIRVRVLATGEIIEIEESAFDAALHERVQDPPAGGITPDDMRQLGTAVGEAVGTAVDQVLERLGAGTPANPPAHRGGTPPVATIGNVTPAAEARYLSLPEWERAYRSPEGDLLAAAWLQARAANDGPMLTAIEALDAENQRLQRDAALAGLRAQVENMPEGAQRERLERALATTPDSAGGSLVPTPLANVIILKRDKLERIGPRAMRMTTTSDSLPVPTEATVGAVAGVLENATIGETDSTFGEVTLLKRKAGRRVRASRELSEDISAAFTLVTILSNQAGRKFAVYNDTQAAQSGNGVAPNWTDSLAQNASIQTVASTGGSQGTNADKMKLLLRGLPTEWRDGGGIVFLANGSALAILDAIKDTTGRGIFQGLNERQLILSDAGDNVAGAMLGQPVLEVPLTDADVYVALLSELYAVLDDGTIRAESTTEGDGAFENDQTVWKFVQRRDGAVMQPDAARKTDAVITA